MHRQQLEVPVPAFNGLVAYRPGHIVDASVDEESLAVALHLDDELAAGVGGAEYVVDSGTALLTLSRLLLVGVSDADDRLETGVIRGQ